MANVLLIYRNRNHGKPGTSTLGLGVNAIHSQKTLQAAGHKCSAVAVWQESEISIPADITHCIIEAPWVSIAKTLDLCTNHPHTKIFVRCHSNLAFLQVEPATIGLMREIGLHSETLSNLYLATNSLSLSEFFSRTYHFHSIYLPNLYWQDRVTIKPKINPTVTLSSGSFGAIRLQKNHITGAAAALVLARKLGLKLDFHLMLSEGGSGTREVVQAISSLFDGLSWANLITHQWAPFPLFRRIVMELDIAFHLTNSETFSLSTADCVAEGVPVIASPIIGWLPMQWMVRNTDNPLEAASVAESVLLDYRHSQTGLSALSNICKVNLQHWQNVLS